MARKMKTMDGNQAAAHASYAYTEVAAIYPIVRPIRQIFQYTGLTSPDTACDADHLHKPPYLLILFTLVPIRSGAHSHFQRH